MSALKNRAQKDKKRRAALRKRLMTVERRRFVGARFPNRAKHLRECNGCESCLSTRFYNLACSCGWRGAEIDAKFLPGMEPPAKRASEAFDAHRH